MDSEILATIADTYKNETKDQNEELIIKIKYYMNIKKVQTFMKHFLMYLNNTGYYKDKSKGEESKGEESNVELGELVITGLRTEIYDKNVEKMKNIIAPRKMPRNQFDNLLLDKENIEKGFVVVNPRDNDFIIIRNALRTNAMIDKDTLSNLVMKPVLDNSGNAFVTDNSGILQMVTGMTNPILNDELMVKETVSLDKKPISLEWVKPTGDKPPFKGAVNPNVIIRESAVDSDGNISNINQLNIQLSEEKIKNMEVYKPVTNIAEESQYILDSMPPLSSSLSPSQIPQDYGLNKLNDLLKPSITHPIKKGGKRIPYYNSSSLFRKTPNQTIHSANFVDNIINDALDYLYL